MSIDKRSSAHYLLIIPCSGSKCPDTGLMAAWSRYRGRVFQALRDLLGDFGVCSNIDVVIISAQYGFLRPDSPTENYDVRMIPMLAKIHRPEISKQLIELCSKHEYAESFILLEPQYLHAVDLSILPHSIVEQEISERSIAHLKSWVIAIRSHQCE